MNPYFTPTRVSPDLLAEFNAGTQRARDADHKPTAREVACTCGRRTQSVTGLCVRCRKEQP